MTIRNGKLISLSNASGHYRPSPACLDVVLARLESLGHRLESVEKVCTHANGDVIPNVLAAPATPKLWSFAPTGRASVVRTSVNTMAPSSIVGVVPT